MILRRSLENVCSRIDDQAIAFGVSAGIGGGSSLVPSAIILEKPIPTPSMTARRMAQPIAPFLIALAPPLTASDPPCKKCQSPALNSLLSTAFPSIFVTYGEETSNDSIPGVLLLSYTVSTCQLPVFSLSTSNLLPLDGAVECRKETAPNTEVSS